MPTIKANGIDLYYELQGPQESPLLILSNGIMMGTAAWGFQSSVLSKYFRVLTYDCRGMWQSDHPEGPYTMEMHADDLAALMDALEIPSAHIAGISYGSEVSMMFALKYPSRADSLIIIDGVSQINALLRAQTYPWLLAAERQDAELLLRTSYHMNFSEEWIKANQSYIEGSIERYKEMDMASFTELMHCFYDLDITARLPEISLPTLVVVGEKDLIKGRKYSEIIVEKIAGSEFVIVPGSGHALCLEKPNELNTLLIGFIYKNSKIEKEVKQ